MNRVRYCDTILHYWNPCTIGYGRIVEGHVRTCRDEPMEENCRQTVDKDNLLCPYCGGKVE